MSRFLEALSSGSPVVADGATGTLGLGRGLPLGPMPSLWPSERPDLVEAMHREYAAAGATILLTCTFGANRAWLPAGRSVGEVNRAAVGAARRAAGEGALVAGDVGPTSLAMGGMKRDEARAALAEQIGALVEAGVDAIALETFFSLDELRLAVEAAGEARRRVPLVASMTFEASGRAHDGAAPEDLAALCEETGVDVVGANCCEGPASTLSAVEAIAAVTQRPVWAKPSAGLPARRNRGAYPVGPGEMAEWAVRLASAGANVVGGCCGTTPDTIRAISQALRTV